MATGIRQRHRKDCNRRGKCDCTWQAEVFDREAGQKIRRTFPSYAAARGWRHDALVALKQGRLTASKGATLDDVAEQLLNGARSGAIHAQGGHPFKPATVRTYERVLRLWVLPELGDRRAGDIRRTDIQALVDDLVTGGQAPATVRLSIAALKTIYRREVSRGRIAENPTSGLELPAVRNGRERIVAPEVAAKLLSALPDSDRAVWATAVYAGLRRGELQALRASDVDLTEGIIHVERGWDEKEGEVATKSRERRRVPISSVLRQLLRQHVMRSGRRGDDRLFATTATAAFDPRRLQERADAAWTAAGLERVTLHNLRHTYASYMIAAGVNAKALSTYMGHAKVSMTLDLYGHLMPGSEDEAAGMLDTYLSKTVPG
jgi:integrase